jgi:hypothetical protein
MQTLWEKKEDVLTQELNHWNLQYMKNTIVINHLKDEMNRWNKKTT